MKPFASAIFSIAAVTSPVSFAQSTGASFTGISAAISLNFPTIDVNVSNTLGNSLGKVSASDTNYVLQVAKGLSVGGNGIVTFGAATEVGEMKSTAIGPLQLKATANYALYAELGYALNASSMGYGKLSLNQLTATVSGGGPGLDETLRANGSGFGFGYRHNLLHSTFVQAEIMQIDYGTVVSAAGLVLKPTSTSAMVGVGIKF